MKRIINTVAALLLCGVLLTPSIEARGRNNGQGSPQRTTTPASRPGNLGRPSTSPSTNRPAQPTKPAQPSQPTRPQQPTQPNRPGNNRPGNGNNRPGNGNNRPGNNKPNRPTQPGQHRPGNNRPNGNPGFGGPGPNRPGYRPGTPPPPHHGHHGPVRPNMPPVHAWHRPVPPPGWRAPGYWRPFGSILGVTLGTTINLTINSLMNNGYTITSYGDNSVYVSNVPMLNMMWPDAVLFYNSGGGLCGSRFMYSTSFYDMNRYNLTYNSLVNAYGSPYSVQNTASGMEATWWGTGNQFIRLSYATDYTQNGSLRYFTTLSFGN